MRDLISKDKRILVGNRKLHLTMDMTREVRSDGA